MYFDSNSILNVDALSNLYYALASQNLILYVLVDCLEFVFGGKKGSLEKGFSEFIAMIIYKLFLGLVT